MAGNRIVQIWKWQTNVIQNIYIRNYSGTAWSVWNEILTTANGVLLQDANGNTVTRQARLKTSATGTTDRAKSLLGEPVAFGGQNYYTLDAIRFYINASRQAVTFQKPNGYFIAQTVTYGADDMITDITPVTIIGNNWQYWNCYRDSGDIDINILDWGTKQFHMTITGATGTNTVRSVAETLTTVNGVQNLGQITSIAPHTTFQEWVQAQNNIEGGVSSTVLSALTDMSDFPRTIATGANWYIKIHNYSTSATIHSKIVTITDELNNIYIRTMYTAGNWGTNWVTNLTTANGIVNGSTTNLNDISDVSGTQIATWGTTSTNIPVAPVIVI
jgi:hypothetical protein